MVERARPRRLRFGVFEVDLPAGELRKKGVKIKLQDKPFQILALLLDRPGEVVTREELCQRLWPDGTYVDFDRSVGTALGKLRQALGDSAENPRFVETLSRRGYRLIMPVIPVNDEPATTVSPQAGGERRTGARWILGGVALVLAAGAIAWLVSQRNAPREPSRGTAQITSLAVLPLDNLSADPQQEYFVDGMTDSLITDLAKIGSLRVISRTSSMRFKRTGKSLKQIASELRVDEVVEGTVQRSGDRVRITAQLIDARTDQHLWAETYERDMRDVLAVQADITQSIAGQIRASLMPRDSGAFAVGPRVNPQAHDAYLKGRYHLAKGTESEIASGIEQFQRALRQDPSYAPAFVGLADSYFALTEFYISPAETMPKAKEAAGRALELDERLAEVHTSLGVVHFFHDWDWNAAEKEFKRAIELNPNSTDAHVWYANFLAQMARPREAAEQIQRAEQLDPLSVNVLLNAGWVYYLARQDEQVTRELRKALELDPEIPITHGTVWLGFVPLAEVSPAIASLKASARPKDASPMLLATLAGIDATRGNTREAGKVLAELSGMSKRRYVCPYEMAAAHVALGKKQEALRWLDEAYRQHSICLTDLKTDPRFDPLQAEAHFQDQLRRMNFPP
jgi:TolB-like protein/DNA-binding winged helix-turn-helix (wHTH) protein/tetratricopeptide (TPR) repeat protein